jgi:hypothetical protein
MDMKKLIVALHNSAVMSKNEILKEKYCTNSYIWQSNAICLICTHFAASAHQRKQFQMQMIRVEK